MPQSRNAKANRAQADVFELLIAEGIASALGAELDASTTSAGASKALLDSTVPDAQDRLARQATNAALAAPLVEALIAKRADKHGRVVRVRWKGRTAYDDVADVIVDHEDGRSTRLSLKSVKSGRGTRKNPGLTNWCRSNGLNVSKLMREARSRVIDGAKGIDDTEKTRLKALPLVHLRHEIDDQLRSAIGAATLGIQEAAASLYTAVHERADPEQKRALVNGLLGAGTGASTVSAEDLFLVVATPKSASVHPVVLLKKGADIRFELAGQEGADFRINISAGDRALLRVYVNCTNGLGLSSLCARVFDFDDPNPA